MNPSVKNNALVERVFQLKSEADFDTLALDVYQFQYAHNPVYRQFCQLIRRTPEQVSRREQIPFLPIRFFKSHRVLVDGVEPEITFESSGTTGMVNSRHLVADTSLYRRSLIGCFEQQFGDPRGWCILGLLPSYLERPNASLVWMVQALMDASQHPQQGFYLDHSDHLRETIISLDKAKQPTLLFGVTFALLDWASSFQFPFEHVQILETGGMKGRGRELIREELHTLLQASFGPAPIWSEYGMTELLSQAYAAGDAGFRGPAWMKLLLRESDDPFTLIETTERPISGTVNVIDLANLYSCSFIATDDVGRLLPDGSMHILGRLDYSDMRGCSLLTA